MWSYTVCMGLYVKYSVFVGLYVELYCVYGVICEV